MLDLNFPLIELLRFLPGRRSALGLLGSYFFQRADAFMKIVGWNKKYIMPHKLFLLVEIIF